MQESIDSLFSFALSCKKSSITSQDYPPCCTNTHAFYHCSMTLALKEDVSFRYSEALNEATKRNSSGGVSLWSVAASMNKMYNLPKKWHLNQSTISNYNNNKSLQKKVPKPSLPPCLFWYVGMSCFNVPIVWCWRMQAQSNVGHNSCCHCHYSIEGKK